MAPQSRGTASPPRGEQIADRIRAIACEVARLQNKSLSDWLYRVVVDYAFARSIAWSDLDEAQIIEAVSLRLEGLCRHIIDTDLRTAGAAAMPQAQVAPDVTDDPDRQLLNRAIGHLLARGPVGSPPVTLAAAPHLEPMFDFGRREPVRTAESAAGRLGPAIAAAAKRQQAAGMSPPAPAAKPAAPRPAAPMPPTPRPAAPMPEPLPATMPQRNADLLRLCDEVADRLGAINTRRQKKRRKAGPDAGKARDSEARLDLRPSLNPAPSDSAPSDPAAAPAPSRRSGPGGGRDRQPAGEGVAARAAETAATQAILDRLQRQYEDLSAGVASIEAVDKRVAELDATVKSYIERDASRAIQLEARAAASAQQALEEVLLMMRPPEADDERGELLRRTVEVLDSLSERVDDTGRRMAALESRMRESRGPDPQGDGSRSMAPPPVRSNIVVGPRGPARENPDRPDAAPRYAAPPSASPPSSPAPSASPPSAPSPSAFGPSAPPPFAAEARSRPPVHLGWSLGMSLAASSVAIGGASYFTAPHVWANTNAPAEDQAGAAAQPRPTARLDDAAPTPATRPAAPHSDLAAAFSDRLASAETARFERTAPRPQPERATMLVEEGTAYEAGRGVPRDAARAAALFQDAADLGSADAQFHLGALYERGIGVARDPVRARAFYARAAEGGHPGAMHNLAVLQITDANLPEGVFWFQRAAQAGVRDSQYNLGVLYSQGRGVPRSLSEAYRWFAAAAAQGDAEAARKRDQVAAQLSPEELRVARGRAALPAAPARVERGLVAGV